MHQGTEKCLVCGMSTLEVPRNGSPIIKDDGLWMGPLACADPWILQVQPMSQQRTPVQKWVDC